MLVGPPRFDRSRNGGLLATAALTAALAACAPASSSDSLEPGEPGETHAFLRVERTDAAEGSGLLSEGRASATFLRTVNLGTATERPLVAARLVGALLDVPTAVGCAPRLPAESSVALRTLSPVDLVHAGDVSVQSGGVLTPLAARAYPDVAHLVSGIVYTSPDVAEHLLPQNGVARFRAAGSSAVPAFEAALEAPTRMVFTSVDGRPLISAVARARRGPLTLVWTKDDGSTATPPAATQHEQPAVDPIRSRVDAEYLDLTTSRGARFRCVPARAGSVTVPAEAIGDADEVSVILHRVRTEGFRAVGLASGTLQVDAATAIMVQLLDDDG